MKPEPQSPHNAAQAEQERRVAEALRANLRRRKEQAAAREKQQPDV